jgi:phage terminase small subunit
VNPRQKLFCEYYCGECLGNAEKAAIKAGYSVAYARGNASKLVAKSGVQEYIRELNTKTESDNIATIKDIKRFWSNVMNDEDEIMKNRLRASELLAKAGGIFNNDW